MHDNPNKFAKNTEVDIYFHISELWTLEEASILRI